MKIASYIGLVGPEGIVILVIFGFALLTYATEDELRRLAALGTVSASGKIQLPMFEWRVIKDAFRWALGTAALLTLVGVAFAIIPLLRAPSKPIEATNSPSPPSEDQLEAAFKEIAGQYQRSHSRPTSLRPVEKSTSIVTVQSGGIASFGQRGGQTAGTIINNVPQEHHLPMIVSLASPRALTIAVENPNDVVMDGVHWQLLVFRRSDFAFLSYANQSIGYVKAHSKSSPYFMDLNSIPKATDAGGELPAGGNLAIGDKLIGTLFVDCPLCIGKSLIISLVWGVSGWTYERSGGDGQLLVPGAMTKAGVAKFINALEESVSESNRNLIR